MWWFEVLVWDLDTYKQPLWPKAQVSFPYQVKDPGTHKEFNKKIPNTLLGSHVLYSSCTLILLTIFNFQDHYNFDDLECHEVG